MTGYAVGFLESGSEFMERYVGILGLAVCILLAWAMGSHRRRVDVRLIVGGLMLQFTFAFLILRTTTGRAA